MPTPKIDVSSKVFSDPTTVPAGINEQGQAVFFTVVNNSGLTELATAGHFGPTSGKGDEITFSEKFQRIIDNFGREDKRTNDQGQEVPRLLIVESRKDLNEKSENYGKTLPARVFEAELVQAT
jgi:hypothetical protein